MTELTPQDKQRIEQEAERLYPIEDYPLSHTVYIEGATAEALRDKQTMFTERDIEVAFCLGLLNQSEITIDKLADQFTSAREKIDRIKASMKRGDFEPLPPNPQSV